MLVVCTALLFATMYSNDSINTITVPPHDHCTEVLADLLVVGDTIHWVGSSLGATAVEDYVPGSALAAIGVPVVWHAFELTTCADVRIDYCGSEVTYGTNFWNLLVRSCPLGDEYRMAEGYWSACEEGNPAMLFQGLEPGIWYHPVGAEEGSTAGNYSFTISALACNHEAPAPCDLLVPIALQAGDTNHAHVTGYDTLQGMVERYAWELDGCHDLVLRFCSLGEEAPVVAGLALACDGEPIIRADTLVWDSVCAGMELRFNALAASVYHLTLTERDSLGYHLEVTAVACPEVPVPPANERCADATVVQVFGDGPLYFSGDGAWALPDTNAAGWAVDRSLVWHGFTLPSCADIVLSYCAEEAFEAQWPAWLFAACDAELGVQPTEDTLCGSRGPVLSFREVPAGTWYFAVPAGMGGLASYVVELDVTLCPPPVVEGCPAPGAPWAWGEGHTAIGNNAADATVEGWSAGSDFEGMPATWHAFTLEACSDVSVSYCTVTTWSTILGVLARSCPATELLPSAFSDVSMCANGGVTHHFLGLAAGTYYLPVLADASNGSIGAYELSIAVEACAAARPVGMACSAARPWSVLPDIMSERSGLRAGALLDQRVGARVVWEAFTLTECGDLEVDFCSADPAVQPLALLYTLCPDAPGARRYIGRADTCANGSDGRWLFTGLPAGAYRVPVPWRPGVDPATYQFTLLARACQNGPQAPINDLCSGALALMVDSADTCTVLAQVGDPFTTTASTTPLCVEDDEVVYDLWYSLLTAGNVDRLDIRLVDAEEGMGYELWDACGGTVLDCASEDRTMVVLPDGDYLLRVFGTRPEHTADICLRTWKEVSLAVPAALPDAELWVSVDAQGWQLSSTLPLHGALVRVTDISGRTVHQQRMDLSAGVPGRLTMGRLPVGVYVVGVHHSGGAWWLRSVQP